MKQPVWSRWFGAPFVGTFVGSTEPTLLQEKPCTYGTRLYNTTNMKKLYYLDLQTCLVHEIKYLSKEWFQTYIKIKRGKL